MNGNLVSVLFGLLILSGCTPANTTSEASSVQFAAHPASLSSGSSIVETLFQTTQCEVVSRGGFVLIDDELSLEDYLLSLGESTAKYIAGSVDFDRTQVLVVDFGASSSGGFRNGLVSDRFEDAGDMGIVRLVLPEVADPSKRQTQNVSHLCTLYTIPATHKVIQIRSQYDDVLIEFKNL